MNLTHLLAFRFVRGASDAGSVAPVTTAAIFEVDLKAHLQADSAIAALVLDRIHPLIRQEGADLPAITYRRIFGDPYNSLDGWTSGVIRIRTQIDIWARKYSDMRAIEKAVRARMDTAAATITSTLQLAVRDFEPDTRTHHALLDYYCTFHTTPLDPAIVAGSALSTADFETDLFSHLIAESDVTDIVAARIYPAERPQSSSLPALVYRPSDAPSNTLDGFSSGLTRIGLTIDCLAVTDWEARALARAVVARMNDQALSFRTVIGGWIDAFDDEARCFRVALEFSVWFRD